MGGCIGEDPVTEANLRCFFFLRKYLTPVPILSGTFGTDLTFHSPLTQPPSGQCSSSPRATLAQALACSWPACLTFQMGMSHPKKGLGDKWCLLPSPLFF